MIMHMIFKYCMYFLQIVTMHDLTEGEKTILTIFQQIHPISILLTEDKGGH